VVLVGAGPVGLWTAVQIKVMRPELSVLLLEKHAEYQRSHVLRVSASSFVLAPADARVRALVAGVPAVIRTNDLEDRLLRLAHELRVRIEIRAVASVDEVLCDFPSARVVIGSDGARSIVRRSAFGDALAVNRVLQSIVDLKYEVEGGGAEPLSKLAEAYPTIKLMGYAAEEHIGQARDGRCPVTLRLVVRESDANALEDATFKTPFALPADAARLPPQLMRAICVWLGAKRLLKGERRVRGSERLSCIKLAVYRAAELTRGHGGVALALVGDAAFGVPFFRALNNGLRCGSMLARALAEGPWELGGEAGIAARLRAYAAKASALAKREIALAASKSAVLDVAQMHSRMVAKLPLQVIAWSPRQATLLATREVAFPN
jgi:2-polyprenyl-6-methoxyphenol hydroxylase-like FAD-dependent oxidoreductase